MKKLMTVALLLVTFNVLAQDLSCLSKSAMVYPEAYNPQTLTDDDYAVVTLVDQNTILWREPKSANQSTGIYLYSVYTKTSNGDFVDGRTNTSLNVYCDQSLMLRESINGPVYGWVIKQSQRPIEVQPPVAKPIK